jgi:hypothetical protein
MRHLVVGYEPKRIEGGTTRLMRVAGREMKPSLRRQLSGTLVSLMLDVHEVRELRHRSSVAELLTNAQPQRGKSGLTTVFLTWGTRPPDPLGFIALGQKREMRGRRWAARPRFRTWNGARVAPQHCPILRPGITNIACILRWLGSAHGVPTELPNLPNPGGSTGSNLVTEKNVPRGLDSDAPIEGSG